MASDFQCRLCGAENPQWVDVTMLANMLHVSQGEVRKRLRAGVIPGAERVASTSKEFKWRVPARLAALYVQETKGLT